MQTILNLLDKLFPPSVDRLLASFNRTAERLDASADARHRKADAINQQINDLHEQRDEHEAEASRAIVVAQRIRNLVGE